MEAMVVPAPGTRARPGGSLGGRPSSGGHRHGTGPLLVCVPEMGELRSSYRYNVAALTDAGFSVASMDLRGHGDSDPTFDAYEDVAAGGDILALVEHLGGPAVLVGNSMGAGAAAWAAAERPDLVAGLVLIGPFVRNPPTNPVKALAFRLAMSWPWAPAMWHAFLPSLYPLRKPDDFEEHRAQIRASMRRPATHGRSPRRPGRRTRRWNRRSRRSRPGARRDGQRRPGLPGPHERGWLDRRSPGRSQRDDGRGRRSLPADRGPRAREPGAHRLRGEGAAACLGSA